MPLGPGVPRFLRLTDVAEILNISTTQAYALVRRKELRAVKIGGRGIWRVESADLEFYLDQMYSDTENFIDGHPFGEVPEDAAAGDAAAADAADTVDRNP